MGAKFWYPCVSYTYMGIPTMGTFLLAELYGILLYPHLLNESIVGVFNYGFIRQYIS